MDETRKKFRICLICVVAAAVLTGMIYYFAECNAAERETEEVLNHMFLKELLASLNKEERRLIYLRYFAERTQSQVGEELGISQVQVSRMEKKILKSMREQI